MGKYANSYAYLQNMHWREMRLQLEDWLEDSFYTRVPTNVAEAREGGVNVF